MPTLEDLAYERIVNRLSEKRVLILSAHPPSGKAYDTELIRIPARNRHAGRYHIDLIFIIEPFLFLMELKGKTSESSDDVAKLQKLFADYDLPELLKVIRKRVNRTDVKWCQVKQAVPVIGATIADAAIPSDFVLVSATDDNAISLIVGEAVPAHRDCHESLVKVFEKG